MAAADFIGQKNAAHAPTRWSITAGALMATPPDDTLADLVARAELGDSPAKETLFTALYDDLHRLALAQRTRWSSTNDDSSRSRTCRRRATRRWKTTWPRMNVFESRRR